MSSKGNYLIVYLHKADRALLIEAMAEAKRRQFEGVGSFIAALLRKELSEAK